MGTESDDRRRPTLTGDLATVLEAAPMFRRAPLGYDRFEVDTYVRWAEDELAAADREREHLQSRHQRTHAALDDARELLAHSPGGAGFLQLSRRMGTLLAVATDEAEALRTEAACEAARLVDQASSALVAAATAAARVLASAEAERAGAAADAARIVADAERTRAETTAELAAQRARARATERRAIRQAERLRVRAEEAAAAARLQARDGAVRVLSTGHEQRRRADDAAAATRERLDRDAADRRVRLLDEVAQLERRRAELEAERPPHGRAPQRHTRTGTTTVVGVLGGPVAAGLAVLATRFPWANAGAVLAALALVALGVLALLDVDLPFPNAFTAVALILSGLFLLGTVVHARPPG